MHHFRQALRQLAKTPGFTALAVLTLAIGIAATSAIFAVVSSVLLEPLPFRDAGELVVVHHVAPGLDLDGMGQSDATYLLYRDEATVFDGLALFDTTGATLTGGGDPERLLAAEVTAPFFDVLDAPPLFGRAFDEADGAPGAAPVVLLSEGLWRRRFGADPGVLGTLVELDGVGREVVGVSADRFDALEEGIDLWLPMTIDPANTRLGAFGMLGVARLAPGVSAAAAEAGLRVLIADLEAAFPEIGAASILQQAGFDLQVSSLHHEVVGSVEAILWIVLGAVGFVLLIACANVANLFLVRAEGRQRDTAVRTALGATRRELAAGALAEGLSVAALAGVLGLAGTWGAIRALVRFGPQEVPRLQEIAIDARVLAVTAGVALLTGAVFGMIPVLRRELRELAPLLKDAGRSTTAGRGRQRARQLLVGAQVALALLVLISACLLARSFLHLSRVDPGFPAEGALVADLALPAADYPDPEAAAAFWEQLVNRLGALPGVSAAGALSLLPLSDEFSAAGFVLEDFPLGDGDLPPVLGDTEMVPGTLEALGVPLLEGRRLTLHDQRTRTHAVLVSESLARHYWGEESAVGKRLGMGRVTADEDWLTIVGVVGDVHTVGLTEEPTEMVYLPLLRRDPEVEAVRSLSVVLRTSGEPTALVDGLRQAVWELDPHLPIARVRGLDELVARARAPMAFTLVMLLLAAAVATALGAVGIFGVISYIVSLRTAEFGVRMAFGARGQDILGMVLSQGLLVALGGVAVGTLGAAALSRWLEAVLFQVEPLDVTTFVAIPLLVMGVALVASFVPAQRASRLAPTVALRYE